MIFIPGNPSIPDIYHDFIEFIQTKNPKLEINILSHLGQGDQFLNKDPTISLKTNFDYQLKEIENILLENDYSQVYFIGHSLGCSSLISNIKSLTETHYKFILICPFILPLGKNKIFLRFFANEYFSRFARSSTNFLLQKKILSKKLIEHFMGKTPAMNLMELYLSKPVFLFNFLELVASYIPYFKSYSLTPNLFFFPQSRTSYIFAHDDFWVPNSCKSYLPKESKQIELEIGHDFCLHKDQSILCAQTVCSEFF